MCNTPVLVYQCGHSEPTERVVMCDRAIDNEQHCRPQPKRYAQSELCTACNVQREATRLEQSIQQTRQNCLRLGATPAQMASIEPTYEQMRIWGVGKSRYGHAHDYDSGYGSESSQWSGSQYSQSQSSTYSEDTASLASGRNRGSRGANRYADMHGGYADKTGLGRYGGTTDRFTAGYGGSVGSGSRYGGGSRYNSRYDR